ncbi:uncharacterized protein LOC132547808 [Ylistrum balloti]|uniref:uncharacterized protein LOC132547808 n=1 Tax=Ylistrum balloti TaxID=509963 RepID=UPI002905B141|nr:uncharacterized protein LOC132547808 [Ylistrum balloti]
MTVDISSKNCNLKHYGEGKGRYLPGFVQSTVENIGFQQCIKLCYQKVNCDSINYDNVRLVCEMNTLVTPGQTTEDFLENRPGSVHMVVNKTGLNADQIACESLNCPPNTKCIKLHDNTTICHPEPCRRADYLLSSKLKFCFKIHDQFAASSVAIQTCNSENATLAVIDSAAKLDYYDKQHLRFKYSTRLGFFIAGGKLDGVWKLPDNTILDHTTGWSTVYMNNDGPCLVLWRATGNYVLTDGSCTTPYRFICEEN